MRGEFDLNIEQVLENWTVVHALREIIANAIDEHALTHTPVPETTWGPNGELHVRDWGRGIRYDHLTQNESDEKMANPDVVIGKFGVGLKDALATFHRHGIEVLIRSQFAEISVAERPKHGFEGVSTLHALISPPSDETFQGTDVVLRGPGLGEAELQEAKGLFLKFNGDTVIESNSHGQVLDTGGGDGRIYVNGLCVAIEDNFLFSYNITSVTTALRKALNRERSHVGRTAYTDRVKAILLACSSETVIDQLVADVRNFAIGTRHDESKWLDIAEHAIRHLTSREDVIVITPDQARTNGGNLEYMMGDSEGDVIIIPDNLTAKVAGTMDATGNPIRDLDEFHRQREANFEFEWVEPQDLSASERSIWDQLDRIFKVVGGRPPIIRDVRIARHMQRDVNTFTEAIGIWDSETGAIVVRLDILSSLEQFAGTLLHELAHAVSGCRDVSPGFERELTELLGRAAVKGLMAAPTTSL